MDVHSKGNQINSIFIQLNRHSHAFAVGSAFVYSCVFSAACDTWSMACNQLVITIRDGLKRAFGTRMSAMLWSDSEAIVFFGGIQSNTWPLTSFRSFA